MKKLLYVLIPILLLGLALGLRSRKVDVGGTQAEAKKQVLHLYAMSDYFPDQVIKDFEEKNNCEVRYDNFSSNEELLAKLQAGAVGYDVIVPSDYMVRALIKSNLLLELDKTKLSHLNNLSGGFVTAPFDSGNHYSVPYTWGTTGLAYNSKHVTGTVDSWNVLFDPKYKGHISLLDDEREVLGAMLYKLGFSINTTSKDQLIQAKKLLVSLKPSVRVFASDAKQHLLSGDVWIAHMYSGDAHQVMKTNPEVKYITPKEGAVVWIDTLAIPKGAKNVDLAHAFINMILDTPAAKEITEQLLYSSPNNSLEKKVAEDLRPSYLAKMQAKVSHLEFLEDLGAGTEMWDQLWTEAKSN